MKATFIAFFCRRQPLAGGGLPSAAGGGAESQLGKHSDRHMHASGQPVSLQIISFIVDKF